MIVNLFSLILFIITTLLNLITRVIFSVTASLVLLLLYGLKVPGEAIHGALQHLADAIKVAFKYVLGLVLEAIWLLVSTAVEQVKENVVGMVAYMWETMLDLLDNIRSSVDALLRDLLREIVKQLSDMVTTVVTDLFKNYVDAFNYVITGGA